MNVNTIMFFLFQITYFTPLFKKQANTQEGNRNKRD